MHELHLPKPVAEQQTSEGRGGKEMQMVLGFEIVLALSHAKHTTL